MTDYTPDDIRLAFAESFTLHTMEDPGLTQAYEVFDRFIAQVKADAWDEGYETGCSSLYGTATPSGKPYDPEPNPYRIEGAINE